MRIAVTSQNFRSITGHAGKARRFIVFDTAGGEPREVERLDLPMELSIHEYHGDDHPLFALGLAALVTQGAGQGFVQRMARHGIRVHATSETDPLTAVARILAGEPLPEAPPHDDDHAHGGGHGHRHAHAHGRNDGRGPGAVRVQIAEPVASPGHDASAAPQPR